MTARRSRGARSPAPQNPVTAGSAAPRGGACRSSDCSLRSPYRDLPRFRRLRRQVVWEPRELLGAVLGDDDEVLEPAAAEAGAVQARLEREHLAAQQLLVPDHPEHGELVHVEADAVAERVEEPLLERAA